jgi:hypothetical protein
MIFPAAYLNSPSSMFGHTLLRIDQANVQSDQTALLSYAINFGAYIEGSDNSILYAWKGLMGGYPGLFALVPYQEKLSEYRSLENRDLWEYRLNLTQAEPNAWSSMSGSSSRSSSTIFSSTKTALIACWNCCKWPARACG